MTAGIIIYFTIITGILIFDGVWVFARAKSSDKPILECNFMRYVRPIELLLSMFAITMLELVVQYLELITGGFVNYTTMFLGIFATVYIIDFIIKEFKFKGYQFVVIKTGRGAFKQLTADISVKTHLDDTYIKATDIAALNSLDTQAVVASRKVMRNYLTARCVMAAFMVIVAIASVIAIAMAS